MDAPSTSPAARSTLGMPVPKWPSGSVRAPCSRMAQSDPSRCWTWSTWPARWSTWPTCRWTPMSSSSRSWPPKCPSSAADKASQLFAANAVLRARMTDLSPALAADLDASFEELVRTYQDRLFGFALRLTGCAADAEESVQDAFL